MQWAPAPRRAVALPAKHAHAPIVRIRQPEAGIRVQERQMEVAPCLHRSDWLTDVCPQLNRRSQVTKREDRKKTAPPNGRTDPPDAAEQDLGPGAPVDPTDVAARDDAAGTEPLATIERLESELDGARGELDRATDQFRRLAADFDNYKKRIERERVETAARAQAELVLRLLDIIDDMERVTMHADDASAPLLEGVQLVERKLRQVLVAFGLEKIEAEGAPFDPTMMEGLATVPAEHPEEDDMVADVFQQGYRFKGQVLRPARVRVKQHEA